MPLISKPNYNQIFASQAPDIDKPSVFNNYPEGWGPESRPNNGKPTIKGFNYLQQTSDLKDLWILQNGACLPYDESIEYAEGAPVLKDGVIQYKTAGGFKSRDAVTIPTYNNAADGVDLVTGVPNGSYFNVRSSSDESYIDEYQNVGGSAVATGKRYPSSNALNNIPHNNLKNRDVAEAHPASAILDASGKTQQEVNDNVASQFGNSVELFADSLGVKNFGDGIYRNVTDLWTVGSVNKIYNSQAEAEAALGKTFASWSNVGLNSTVDTFVIQLLLNRLHAEFMSTGIVQTARYKSDAVYVVLGLMWPSGVNHVCDGICTILKRPALDITNEGTLKWWRPVVLDSSKFVTAEQCAPRLVVSGLHFDGNMPAMNWTYNTYSQEHGCNIILHAQSTNALDVRAKFKFERFKSGNSVADALQVRSNVDVIVDNPEYYDSYRGGLVITGGNSIVIQNNGVSENARYDTEIDGTGFGGTYLSYIEINNYTQDKSGGGDFPLGCDIQAIYGGTTRLSNFKVYSEPTNINSSNGATLIIDENSLLTLGAPTSTNNRYMNPSADTIKCKFVLAKDGAALSILPNFSSYTANSGEVCKLHVKFEKLTSAIVPANALILFQNQLTTNPLEFELVVKSSVDSNFVADGIAKVFYKDVEHNSLQLCNFGQLAAFLPKVKIGRVVGSSRTTGLFANSINSASGFANSLELTSDLEVPAAKYVITQTGGNGIFASILSQAVIVGDTPPTATTHSYNGDTYKLRTPVSGKPYEWVAITPTHSKTASAWRASKWAFGSFTTDNLPVLTNMDAGCQNFDSTLGKVVTWNGAAWI